MGNLIGSFDWSKTPIGPIDSWSPTLRTIVDFLLSNRFPIMLWWGPEYISFYNDAYIPVLGRKHPWGLGRPVRECWSEAWDILKPLIDTPFSGGPATWSEDIELQLKRTAFTEETHFTIAYSPVPDESAPGGVGGVLATVHEITQKVVGERRVHLLQDLGARAAETKTPEEACSIAAGTLARYPKDVPFALLYLIDDEGKRARLAGAAGMKVGDAASPLDIGLVEDLDAPWALAPAGRAGSFKIVEKLCGRIAEVPPGPWPDPPEAAVLMPVRSNMAHQLAGVLVMGISSRLQFDDAYRGFCDLLASQVAAAVANARAYDEERKRAEALAEIDRAKTVFFSNVSHEFRTPLTLILGPIKDMLARATPEQREDLELAHRNGLRMQKLVNTLLDFSRMEADRVQASYAPADLAVLTEDLASNFRSLTERAGLTLIVDCPPLPEPVYIYH
jgi:GAF domain-containing protein